MRPLQSVYLARHGQTEGNMQGRWQGQLDTPLTALGRAQARTVADLVAGEPVDAVFCSPQGRAAATAQVCGDRLGLPVTPVDELAELYHGAMAGMTPQEMEDAFPSELARRRDDKYRWRFPGGESYEDAVPRAADALARVASSGARRPLLVSARDDRQAAPAPPAAGRHRDRPGGQPSAGLGVPGARPDRWHDDAR